MVDGTLQELSSDLRAATEEMKKADCSITSVQSGCELFQRFITFAALDQSVHKIVAPYVILKSETKIYCYCRTSRIARR